MSAAGIWTGEFPIWISHCLGRAWRIHSSVAEPRLPRLAPSSRLVPVERRPLPRAFDRGQIASFRARERAVGVSAGRAHPYVHARAV